MREREQGPIRVMGKELLKVRGGYFNAKGGFTEKRDQIRKQLDFKKRIWKGGRDEPTCGAAGGDADMENTRVDPLGEGEGGMNPDSGVGRYAGPRARETQPVGICCVTQIGGAL